MDIDGYLIQHSWGHEASRGVPALEWIEKGIKFSSCFLFTESLIVPNILLHPLLHVVVLQVLLLLEVVVGDNSGRHPHGGGGGNGLGIDAAVVELLTCCVAKKIACFCTSFLSYLSYLV